MKTSLTDQLDRATRQLVPVGLTLLLVILSVAPVQVPAYGTIAPAVSLIAVFYWALSRPELQPAPAVFAIGLIEDVLHGYPLGSTAVVLLLAHLLVIWQRRHIHGKPFLVIWLAFAFIAVGAALLRWSIVGGLDDTAQGLPGAVFQALMTVAVFPLIVLVLSRVQATVLRHV